MTPPAPAAPSGGRSPWRVIVTGGRSFTDERALIAFLDGVCAERGRLPSILRHGGATGADALADRWARMRGVEPRVYPADWATHGPAAGPIRNAAMLADGADLVVAFPGGKGTADMVAKARAAGVPVIEVLA